MNQKNIEERAINTIRFLSADGVQKANSGHPGLPMGAAGLTYALWGRHLKYNPENPSWPDRDRFVLSAGHGSMLLYSMLHLAGYDLPLTELKNFRQWGSKTPGHPEYGLTPGVEMTTGPLGQGFSSAVGMAIAVENLAARFNKETFPIVDHYIYVLASDGDLMEGVSSEAASLAGHLKLGRLIVLYDDNKISIDGSTNLAFTEDRAARFTAYGWQVLRAEGNNVEEVSAAISAAKEDPRPTIIVCKTHIGFGLPTKQDTAKAHGEPAGVEELAAAKKGLGWPEDSSFLIPDDVKAHFAELANRGKETFRNWENLFTSYSSEYPELAAEFEIVLSGDLPEDLEEMLPVFPADAKGMATRASSGKVLAALADKLPHLIGGSADLTGSNKTQLGDVPAFSVENRTGRYLHYGVREHAMGAAMNGLALHGGFIPYGGTFLVFSDYVRPAIRLSALMDLRVIYVFTHDSIGLGEDGPTHQPIEHLAALRSIPELVVIRPADANETAYAWLAALDRRHGPTAMALSRQNLPTIDRSAAGSAKGLLQGAYVLIDPDASPEIILMASGSEVALILDAAHQLAGEGIAARVVSFPSWELFAAQPLSYQQMVLPPELKARVAVEAGTSQGWHRWVGDSGEVLSIERFGASAPYLEIYEHLGLTVEGVVEAARRTLGR
ncbi:MAG: transketolase [Anaerolineales bacterium]|nr:transketolase [Anaerolineales bacterium]